MRPRACPRCAGPWPIRCRGPSRALAERVVHPALHLGFLSRPRRASVTLMRQVLLGAVLLITACAPVASPAPSSAQPVPSVAIESASATPFVTGTAAPTLAGRPQPTPPPYLPEPDVNVNPGT